MPATTSDLSCLSTLRSDGVDVCIGARHRHHRSQEHQADRRLAVLQLTPLLPSRTGTRRAVNALVALQRIETIEVRASEERMDGVVYHVDIYDRVTRSRIPVHGAYARLKTPARAAVPSASVDISYEDVLQLSHRAYELTRLSHTTASCVFCRPVIFFNTTSMLKPRWNTHWFKSDHQVCEMLTRYLQEMLKLTSAVPACGADLCHGQERVARLLQRYLTPASEESERASS